MKHKRTLTLLALAVLLATLAGGSGAMAQDAANYSVTWYVIGGGGRPIDSASYAVNSTAGQGGASPPYQSSTSYIVSGGYWYPAGAPDVTFTIHLPLIVRGSG